MTRAGPSAAFPWDEAIAAGLGALRLRPSDFWAMTPRELTLAFKGAGGLPTRENPLRRGDLDGLMRRFPDI